MRSIAHKKAVETLNHINKNRNNYYVIHYSCESFIKHPDRSVRITSITISPLRYHQATTFSISNEAELMHIPYNEIENHYDVLEKKLLTKYYRYIEKHQSVKWIHWNMRDSNYGFQAIEHRARTLGVNGIRGINDESKIDFAILLEDYYGEKYIEDPHMAALAKKTRLT